MERRLEDAMEKKCTSSKKRERNERNAVYINVVGGRERADHDWDIDQDLRAASIFVIVAAPVSVVVVIDTYNAILFMAAR